jgi:hypothetical protein
MLADAWLNARVRRDIAARTLEGPRSFKNDDVI